MTNGVKRPKAIIKDPKACQADGGSFVYKQSFIGKLKLATHVLAFKFLLTKEGDACTPALFLEHPEICPCFGPKFTPKIFCPKSQETIIFSISRHSAPALFGADWHPCL